MKIEAPTSFSNNFLSRFMFVTESSTFSQNFMKERYVELKSKLDQVMKEHDKISESTDELETEISIKMLKFPTWKATSRISRKIWQTHLKSWIKLV